MIWLVGYFVIALACEWLLLRIADREGFEGSMRGLAHVLACFWPTLIALVVWAIVYREERH